MKIAVYSPYLDSAGGGEKYMMTIAQCLSSAHQVDVLIDKHLESIGLKPIKDKLEKLHNLDLSKVNFILSPVGKGSVFLERLFFLKKYDWFFCNTDGSLFYTTAKNNVIHFQVPFENIYQHSPWGKAKVNSWQLAITNSEFTQKIINQNWPIKSVVLYPPVSVQEFKPLAKKKQIISVGRFFGYLKDKKQDLMIKVFKEMVNEYSLNDWSLHLVGAASDEDLKFVEELKQQAKGSNIYFYPNLSFDKLVKSYAESQIYWHALGFGQDDPKKQEHFGITTVEAMASGCIPVVINKGGQKEIVEEGINGYLWDDTKQLKEKTIKIIKDQSLQANFSKNGFVKAQKYSTEQFEKNIQKIVSHRY